MTTTDVERIRSRIHRGAAIQRDKREDMRLAEIARLAQTPVAAFSPDQIERMLPPERIAPPLPDVEHEEDGDHLFIVLEGQRIAFRHPGGQTWVPMLPGWHVAEDRARSAIILHFHGKPAP